MANYNLDKTLSLVLEIFRTKDPEDMSTRAAVSWDNDRQVFLVPYLNTEVEVTYPTGDVTSNESNLPIVDSIMVLHYLVHATGLPIQNNLISFKELPDGAIYNDPFTKRAITPFIKNFSNNIDKLKEWASKFGGKPAELGDVSYTIPIFPRVSITYVLWEGDDEFPPNATILFDRSAGAYLPTENYAMLAGMLLWK